MSNKIHSMSYLAHGHGADSVLRATGSLSCPLSPAPLSPCLLPLPPVLGEGPRVSFILPPSQPLCWFHLFQVTLHTGLEVPTNLGRPKLSGN